MLRIREEHPELVTNQEFMTREYATEAVETVHRTIDELEPITIDDASLSPYCGRRSLIDKLEFIGAKPSADRLSLSLKTFRLGICRPLGPDDLTRCGYSNEIDIKASWPTVAVQVCAQLKPLVLQGLECSSDSDEFRASSALIEEAGINLKSMIVSQAECLPQTVKLWTGRVVTTVDIVKKHLLHLVSNPRSQSELKRDTLMELYKKIPLLSAFRCVWKHTIKHIGHILETLQDAGYSIPFVKRSTDIHRVLTYFESGNMSMLAEAIRESLDSRSINIKQDDFIYRSDALAVHNTMSSRLPELTEWVAEINERIQSKGGCFKVALKDMVKASEAKKLQRVSKTVKASEIESYTVKSRDELHRISTIVDELRELIDRRESDLRRERMAS